MFRQSQLVMLHSAWLNFGACDMIIRPLMRSHRRWGPNDHPDSSCPEPFCGDASLKIFTQYPSQGQLSAGVVITKNTQKTLVGSMSKYTTLRSTRNTEETQRFFFPHPHFQLPETTRGTPSRRNTRSQRGHIQVMCLSMGNSYNRPLAKLGNLCQVHLNSVTSYLSILSWFINPII